MASAGPCKHDEKALFNFGTATADELNVCGSARPGAEQQRCYAENVTVLTTADEVQQWVDFVKSHGVQSVVSMLSPSELQTYAEPLQPAMEAAFGPGNYLNVDPKASAAPQQIMSAVKAARDAGKKVLVHCWGGGGRTGKVLAAHLVMNKGFEPQQAVEAVTGYASSKGLARRADVESLREFVAAAGGSGTA